MNVFEARHLPYQITRVYPKVSGLNQ